MAELASMPLVTSWTQLVATVLAVVILGMLVWLVWWGRNALRAKLSRAEHLLTKADSILNEAIRLLELVKRTHDLTQAQRSDTAQAVREVRQAVAEVKGVVTDVTTDPESGWYKKPPPK